MGGSTMGGNTFEALDGAAFAVQMLADNVELSAIAERRLGSALAMAARGEYRLAVALAEGAERLGQWRADVWANGGM